ncbi:murein hydrolase activator EnvC [uncultured Dialister sp.]|jgi:murein DD-endopeptidase MepM/ murein hydrolase activator NlpD|uniref:murein hydrolase activator EnvC family protein n=1 Tax=uncultured Dialister sp. TaxID=278064 RepID=UPI002610D953|nr:M23 family metallopeptidase [uncultured Dialister sp.]
MKRSTYMASLLTISLLLGGQALSMPSYADDLDDQVQDLQGQIDSSRLEQENWQQVIEDVSAKLKQIQADLDAANARLQGIRNKQAEINAQIAQTQNEIVKMETYLKTRQNVLNRRVRAIYMHGQLNYLEVILGANSFSDFANRVELLKRIIRSDYNLILEIQKQKAAIEAKKAQLEEDKRQLDVLAAEAEKTQKEIAAKKAEQQKVLDAAKSNKAAAAQMEQDLNAQLASVRNLIQQRLAAAEAARQAAQQAAESDNGGGGGSDDNYVQGTGAMSWPCSGPITSPFGYRTHPIFGTTIFHAGIDIGVDYGTPIHAADSGVVVYSGWISGYGNAVIIDHGGGVSTLYGHNQSLAVSEGQSVSKGSVVAYAGSTGNSTGPHCHFEVDVNGSPVNPMGYL